MRQKYGTHYYNYVTYGTYSTKKKIISTSENKGENHDIESGVYMPETTVFGARGIHG